MVRALQPDYRLVGLSRARFDQEIWSFPCTCRPADIPDTQMGWHAHGQARHPIVMLSSAADPEHVAGFRRRNHAKGT